MRNIIATPIIFLVTCLAAYAQYGGTDGSFGTQGVIKRNIGPKTSSGAEKGVAGVLQPDGKLVVVASVSPAPAVVMRYNTDGTLDNTFDGDGIASLYITPTSVALQSDGKIVVGGYLTNDYALFRYNVDGTADVTFSGDGLVTTDWNAGVDNLRGIAIQPDGKIVAVGEIRSTDVTYDFGIARYNTNGVLDNTFGASGKVALSFGTNVYDYCYAVALQTDGKIVAVGNTFPSGSNGDCAIARLTTSGALDATFGTGGKTTTSMGSPYSEEFYAVAIQADGKIVCAGDQWGVSFNNQVIARYTTTGALDVTFNGTGKITTSLSTYNDQANGVAIQADGKIVVAGLLFNASWGDAYTARYNTNGTLDATYNGTGIKQVSYGPQHDQFNGVVIQPDGKIMGIGTTSTAASGDDYLLARYNTNGSNDASFNSTGQVISGVGGSNDLIFGLAIQPDGKLVAAGYTNNGTNNDFALVRYNDDGSPDLTFNGTGQVVTAIGTGADAAQAVVVQPNGKIVAAGYSLSGTYNAFTVVRYNTDGTLDNTFSGDGIATAAVGTGNAGIRSIAIQPDGKIVVAGIAHNGSNNDFALARFNINGSLDATFDADGLVTTAPGTLDDIAYGIAIQPDGKIVVAGYAYNGTYDVAVVRYNTNGSLDNTFGSSGKVMTPVGAAYDQATGIVLQPDGKIVVGGYANSGSSLDFAVVRYNTNGSLDNTFGSSGKVLTPVGAYDDYAFGIDLQSDGKIVQAGYAYNGTNNNMAVVRYNSNGILDNTFGSSGKSVLSLYPNAVSQAQAVKVFSSRIYVAGNIISEMGNDFVITAVQSGLVSLPLTLLSFNGRLVDNEAHLKWETTGEINTLEFVIERSADGVHYVKIGTVPTVNTAGKHSYTFTDRNLTTADGKNLFYRLKQTDLDGRFTYSSTVILSPTGKETIVKLFPNPVTDNASLLIGASAQELITYRIIDNKGAVVRSATAVLLQGSNSISVNTRALKAGTYTLDINGARTSKQIRFIKR